MQKIVQLLSGNQETTLIELQNGSSEKNQMHQGRELVTKGGGLRDGYLEAGCNYKEPENRTWQK